MENPLFTGCLLTSYNVCLVERIMFQEQLTNYKLKVIDMNWEFLLNQWVRILHCNIYVVNGDYEIEKVYGDLIAESSPLYMDPEFFMMLVDRKVKEYPDIYCEYNSVLYASMLFESKKLVIGPVSIIKPTRELEKFMTDTHLVSNRVHHQTAFCDMKVFGAGVLALYHCISGKELTIDELWQKNGLTGIRIGEARESVQKVIFHRQEAELPHNPYDQEKRELDSIRRGDKEMLRRSLQETYRGEVGRLSNNELRQAKNIAICVITLASRAAIDGGLLPEEAFSMVDGYILKIEEMKNIVKIDAAMRQAEYEFVEQVGRINVKKERNELIEKTKNFIFQNLHSEIVIGEIGHQIGVSTTYLSDLFRRVEGITIQQYIRREKIRLAENLLRYSEYDVKSIAIYLAFCSQSHFGKIFKDQTGLTPTKYREKFGQFQKTKIHDN